MSGADVLSMIAIVAQSFPFPATRPCLNSRARRINRQAVNEEQKKWPLSRPFLTSMRNYSTAF